MPANTSSRFRCASLRARTLINLGGVTPLLSLLLALGMGSSAKADGTLTLTLPPSQATTESRITSRIAAPAPRRSAKGLSGFSSFSRSGFTPFRHAAAPTRHGTLLASRGQTGAGERVVGRLGVLPQSEPIFATRSRHGRKLIDAPAGTYLAIKGEEGNWLGVLMADGSIGWLDRSNVRVLDYQVVSTGTPAAAAAPSVPGYADPGDIYPRSAAPYFAGDARALLTEAYKYLGVPYVWGGNTTSGIDCSGFVKKVFAANGYELPRLGSDQMAHGVAVPKDQLQPGDRLYFGRRTERVGVKHTGIYIGNGYFIHASSSRRGVAVSSLNEAMYQRMYVCARR